MGKVKETFDFMVQKCPMPFCCCAQKLCTQTNFQIDACKWFS